jgi:hypothetical protein
MQQKNKNGFAPIWMILFILVVLMAFCIFIYWRMFFSGPSEEMSNVVEKKISEAQNSQNSPRPTVPSSQSSQKDAALVGTWLSDCLVPDPGSPWSEKHQFVINSDGTAVHTRWSSSGHDCSPETTLTDKYQYEIPASGQINLLDIEKGATIYDIYQISGSRLYFGHGFRGDHLAYPGKFGGSSADRINNLNSYIAYQKNSE